MNNFIKTKDTAFVDGNGHEYIIKGMGFWGGNAQTAPNSFREADFANMASIGFNSIRLYLGANFIENDESVWNWLDERIEWARKYNMTLVLNLHFTPGAKSISDTTLFVDIGLQDRLIALWQSIAKRYVDEPIIAAYDIVNEPTANVVDISKMLGVDSISAPYHEIFAIWENLANRIVAAIREVDTNHVIIVERLWLSGCADNTSPNDQQDRWQNLNGKFNFPDISDPADNYAYTYHCYEPGRYVHQSAGTPDGEGSERVYPSNTIAKHDGGWKMNKDFLEHAYTIPLNYIKSKNVPAYIGELGIHSGNFESNSRGINKGGRQWMLDLMEILAEYRLSFSFHPYYEAEIRPNVYPPLEAALREGLAIFAGR